MITVGCAIAAAISNNFKPQFLFLGTLFADVWIVFAITGYVPQ